MSARTLTLAALGVLILAAAVLAMAGHRRRLGLVPPGELLRAATGPRAGRVAVALCWAWLGWHLLAR